MVYLFLGQDSPSKNITLKKIRQEILAKETEQFNLDILYARELSLRNLQERLLFFPVKNSKRIIVIKNAQNLKEELKEFIINYVKKPYKQIILVLDIDYYDKKDEFINRINRYVRTFRFKEIFQPDTFTLSRQIELRRTASALEILNQLLKNGERPERILGGLRYVWERDEKNSLESRKRLRLLLNCDIEIKTGKLKPVFALEKLLICLCSFYPGKHFH
jgi:DNA polymerase III delta subunit